MKLRRFTPVTYFSILALLIFLSGCRPTSKPVCAPAYENWETALPPHDSLISYSIFLTGDAGNFSSLPLPPELASLKASAEAAGRNAAVIFLGDNIYPSGIPSENSPARKSAEQALDIQLEVVRNFRGKTIFIPGNHDWNESRKGGYQAVLREEAYIEKRLGDPQSFLPDGGCPGPQSIRLSPEILLITADLDWWLSPFPAKEAGSNCGDISFQIFCDSIARILARHPSDKIVFAAHHPLFSNGLHGGFIPAYMHVFPLLAFRPYLFVPLPVIGTLMVISGRKIFHHGGIQHPSYLKMKKELIKVLGTHPGLIYASGHEHNLQYFKKEGMHFLISGAGSSTTPIPRKRGAEFHYAGLGWMRLDFYSNGECWLTASCAAEKPLIKISLRN